MIRSVAFSYAGEPGFQADFEQAAQPDGLAVVLSDGSTIFVGDRDGYGPPAVWVIGPDGEDVWDSPLFPAEAAADNRLIATLGRTVAPEAEAEMRMAYGDR